MKNLVKWLIKKFIPGYHLSKNPIRQPKEEVKENAD